MKKGLVTLEYLIQEQMNRENRDVSTTQGFMSFYLWILELARNNNQINEENRNAIASLILEAISLESTANTFVMENYIYVISMRLQTMSNFQAWKMLSSINNLVVAKRFLEESRKWFEESLNPLTFSLQKGKEMARKLGILEILEDFDALTKCVSDLFNCLETDNRDCRLKQLHRQSLMQVTYEFVWYPETYKSYPQFLEKVISNYCMEMQILCKINSDGIIQRIQNEKKRNTSHTMSEAENLLKNNQAKYIETEEWYEKRIENALKEESRVNALYNQMYELFLAKNPEMSEDEAEEVFDEMNEDFFEKNPYEDVEKLRRERDLSLKKLSAKIDKYQRMVDAEVLDKYNAQGELRDSITLLRVLKEIALLYYTSKGIIPYPNTLEEKGIVIGMIDMNKINEAVIYFSSLLNLTEEELDYING